MKFNPMIMHLVIIKKKIRLMEEKQYEQILKKANSLNLIK